MLRCALFLSVALASGCASPQTTSDCAPSRGAGDEGDVGAPDAAETGATPGFELTITVGDEGLAVETVARGDGLDRFAAGGSFTDLEARDARGALEARREDDAEAGLATLSFDRDVEPPLRLRYRVPRPERFTEAIAFGPEVTHFDGRAWLLPREESPCEILVQVRGVPGERVATTLGRGATHRLLTFPARLRDVTVAVGPFEASQFEALHGHDVVLSLGPHTYDSRWVAAEIALSRTRVEAWFRNVDREPFTTVIVPRPPSAAPGFAAARSGLGMRILAREDADWSSEARLTTAQVLARQWVGGVLRFVGPDGEDEAWASFGLSRWIAQEVLTRLGTVTSYDRARDLTMLEAIVTFDDPTAPPAVVAMARGTLYAGGLDARLRAAGHEGLRALVTELVFRAEDQHGAPLPRAAFEEVIRAALGEPEVTRFRAEAVGDSRAVEMPADTFGRCLRRGRTRHRHFTLGFDAPDPDARDSVVSGVVEGSPAYRAGLRNGMRIDELRYRPGDANTDVQLVVIDGDARRDISFRAYDREATGSSWTRIAGIEEAHCLD